MRAGRIRSVVTVGVVLAFVPVGASCTNAIKGSGHVTSSPVPVTAFSGLVVSGSFDVTVTTGKDDAVTLRVDDNLLTDLDVGVTDGVLHIGPRSDTSFTGATLEADVTAQALSSIEASGASTVHLPEQASFPTLDVTASGASHVDGRLVADQSAVNLSGASNVSLTGVIGELTLDVSGASACQAEELETRSLTVSVSGASSAKVFVTDTISADVSGASSLQYRGEPTFTAQETSGGSSIQTLP